MGLDSALDKIPFGQADITFFDGEDKKLSFNGKDYFQAEGGEVTLTPTLADITSADFGESPIDKRITGHGATLSFSALTQEIEIMKLALAFADEITDASTGETVGMMDGKIGSSLRKKGRKVVIHPRIMGADNSLDITLYKVIADGDFTRGYANEQGNVAVAMSALPRDGMDANEAGNFWYIGPVDPHE